MYHVASGSNVSRQPFRSGDGSGGSTDADEFIRKLRELPGLLSVGERGLALLGR